MKTLFNILLIILISGSVIAQTRTYDVTHTNTVEEKRLQQENAYALGSAIAQRKAFNNQLEQEKYEEVLDRLSYLRKNSKTEATNVKCDNEVVWVRTYKGSLRKNKFQKEFVKRYNALADEIGVGQIYISRR